MLICILVCLCFFFFFFNDTATTEIYTLSLHDALPISQSPSSGPPPSSRGGTARRACRSRSEEHTSELQSLRHLVCRLLLEKKKAQRKPRQGSSNSPTRFTPATKASSTMWIGQMHIYDC